MIVRPIIYTATPEPWKGFVNVCGAVPISDGDVWSVYGLGRGRLGIHLVDGQRTGQSSLGIETVNFTDIDSPHVESFRADHGDALAVRGHDLPRVLIDSREGTVDRGGELIAAPLLWTAHVADNIPILASLGLALRVKSTSGAYADFTSDGVVALHERTMTDPDNGPRVELAFEHPNLDALAEVLAAAGFESARVDEAYGRSLHVEVGTEQAWVNETQTDLYGYTANAGT